MLTSLSLLSEMCLYLYIYGHTMWLKKTEIIDIRIQKVYTIVAVYSREEPITHLYSVTINLGLSKK